MKSNAGNALLALTMTLALSMPLALTLAMAGSPANAADAKSQKQCAEAFDACVRDCETTYKDDAGGRAACMPQCSGKYAACDAGVAYDKAKPWLEEQANKTKKFFDDLMKGMEKDAPADATPKNKSI
jgi:predicted lipoprotein with Yx(FWY)xxD motif